MTKKRRRPLMQDDRPAVVANGAPFTAPEASSDLYDAWQGQVRALDDQAVEPSDAADAMLAQLHAVADELSQPTPRFTPPKLLAPRDRDDEPVSPTGAAPSDMPTIELATVQQLIDSVAGRIEALIAKSQDQLASRMAQAVAAAGDRNGLVHRSVLSDAEGRLEVVQQQLAEANEQLDESRHQLERARLQQSQTVERLVERTAELAQLHAEHDASREAEWERALEGAIGMLSVLESLDDVIASVRLKSDRRAMLRFEHFEREARQMARLVELEEIATAGCVDPDQHEIVSTVGGKVRTGTIVEVRQRGYMFRGRILRRAQVVVSARE